MVADCGSNDCSNIGISNKRRRLDVNAHVSNERKANRAIVKFIRSNKLRLHCLLDESFQEFVHMLNPQFRICSAIVWRECIEMYKEEKAEIKEILKNLDGQISLSVEIFSYKKCIGYRPVHICSCDYLCLTAHFIDEKWKLRRWDLNFWEIESLVDNSLERAILKSLSAWDIESKISTLNLGYNDNCDKTFQIVKDRIQEKKKLQLNGRVFRATCCLEIFSSMARDAFEKIEDTIHKVRRIIFWENPLPAWEVTLGRLQMVLKRESDGDFLSKDNYNGFEIPSAEEWKKVRGVCKLVESMHKVAGVLFGSLPSTSNICLHLLGELRAALTQESTSSDGFIRTLAKQMLERFDKYYKDMFLVLAIATVLDPRFKMKYIEFSSTKYEGIDGNSRVSMVLESIHCLYEDYVTHNLEKENSQDDPSSFPSEDEFDDEEAPPNPYDDFSFFQEYHKLIDSTSQPPKSELSWYLEEPVLPWIQDFDALSWWRAASSKYPILSRIARDFLAIPIAVHTLPEAYSTGKREIDEHVWFCGHEWMNAMLCPRSWVRG